MQQLMQLSGHELHSGDSQLIALRRIEIRQLQFGFSSSRCRCVKKQVRLCFTARLPVQDSVYMCVEWVSVEICKLTVVVVLVDETRIVFGERRKGNHVIVRVEGHARDSRREGQFSVDDHVITCRQTTSESSVSSRRQVLCTNLFLHSKRTPVRPHFRKSRTSRTA